MKGLFALDAPKSPRLSDWGFLVSRVAIAVKGILEQDITGAHSSGVNQTLTHADFEAIMELEESLFASKGDKALGAFYVRLCCDFYGDTSFIARADGKPIGYILSFVRDREAYCSTLAIVPSFQRTRAVHYL